MHERLGLLGGTFDPPHLGHLLVAYTALEGLGLTGVRLIPAHQQPLKRAGGTAAAGHRLAMTRLLAAVDPRLAVDPIELDRGGLSFTIDTVRAYRTAHPNTELVLLLGEDAVRTLPHWREPEALAVEARIVAVTRGDEGADGAGTGFAVERLRSRRVDISSTEIRARVRDGLPIRGFVPDAIADYIETHGLYRTTQRVNNGC